MRGQPPARKVGFYDVPFGIEKVCELPEQDKTETPDAAPMTPAGDTAETPPADSPPDPAEDIIAPADPEPTPVQGGRSTTGVWVMGAVGTAVALAGFVAGKSVVFDRYLPEVLRAPSVDLAGVEARLDTLDGQAQELRAALEQRDDAQRLAALIALLNDRISALEAAPPPSPAPTLTPTTPSTDLTDLRQQLEAQQAALREMQDQAQAQADAAQSKAKQILAQAAASRILAALDSGAPFADAAKDLTQSGVAALPLVLAQAAPSGVPSLAMLRADFPVAARQVLADSRSNSDDTGLVAFVKRQLGARSVTPREGPGTDAVLSRAEAALGAGDLDGALNEISALSDAPALASWLAAAKRRQQAVQAAAALMLELQAN